MNGFISHIINRHQFTDGNVAPRLPARFEPQTVPNLPAWQQDGVHTETIQNTVHSDAGKITENNYRQNQELQPADSRVMPAAGVQKTAYPIAKDTLQPLIVKQADKAEKINIESAALAKHAVQNTITEMGINPAHHSGPQLIYEPSPLRRVNEETDIKNMPVVNPDILKPAPEKQGIRQPSSRVMPVVVPATRHSNTALRFSTVGVQEQQLPQVIKVSIGRIEVRAVQAAAPVKTARVETPKPKMSLDEYLNKRNSTR